MSRMSSTLKAVTSWHIQLQPATSQPLKQPLQQPLEQQQQQQQRAEMLQGGEWRSINVPCDRIIFNPQSAWLRFTLPELLSWPPPTQQQGSSTNAMATTTATTLTNSSSSSSNNINTASNTNTTTTNNTNNANNANSNLQSVASAPDSMQAGASARGSATTAAPTATAADGMPSMPGAAHPLQVEHMLDMRLIATHACGSFTAIYIPRFHLPGSDNERLMQSHAEGVYVWLPEDGEEDDDLWGGGDSTHGVHLAAYLHLEQLLPASNVPLEQPDPKQQQQQRQQRRKTRQDPEFELINALRLDRFQARADSGVPLVDTLHTFVDWCSLPGASAGGPGPNAGSDHAMPAHSCGGGGGPAVVVVDSGRRLGSAAMQMRLSEPWRSELQQQHHRWRGVQRRKDGRTDAQQPQTQTATQQQQQQQRRQQHAAASADTGGRSFPAAEQRSHSAAGADAAGGSVDHDAAGSSVAHDAAGSSVAHDAAGSSVDHDAAGSSVHHDAARSSVHHDAAGSSVHHDAAGSSVHHDAAGSSVHRDAVAGVEGFRPFGPSPEEASEQALGGAGGGIPVAWKSQGRDVCAWLAGTEDGGTPSGVCQAAAPGVGASSRTSSTVGGAAGGTAGQVPLGATASVLNRLCSAMCMVDLSVYSERGALLLGRAGVELWAQSSEPLTDLHQQLFTAHFFVGPGEQQGRPRPGDRPAPQDLWANRLQLWWRGTEASSWEGRATLSLPPDVADQLVQGPCGWQR
ncbi:MAG: hypothetical protein WDW36_008164 [Sanguina aurantia]